MLITSATLDALRTTFGAQFQAAYSAAPAFWQSVATEIPSNTKSNTYGWVAQQLRLREWIGPRVAQNLSEHDFEVINRPFEGTVEVDRDDIEDDNLGLYSSIMVPQLGEATKKHPDVLLAELLQGSRVGFDGVSFFNATHPTFAPSGATYSNVYTSKALTGPNFNEVWSDMASRIGEDGLPLGVMGNLLVVPPQLKLAAHNILQSATYSPQTGQAGAGAIAIENGLKGWADVLVVPYLANQPTTWYLLDVSRVIKPFIYQVRRQPQFVSRDNPQDPKVFDLKKYTYGVDYRGEVAPTLPFLASKASA
jgi:phage major head subunit gpT-like protein